MKNNTSNLAGFTRVHFNDIFMTVRKATIDFSKSAIDTIGKPRYVNALIDEEGKRFAIQTFDKANHDHSSAIEFFVPPEPGKQEKVRWASVYTTKMLMELAGVEDFEAFFKDLNTDKDDENKKKNKGIRFYGKYIEDENAIIFDMQT